MRLTSTISTPYPYLFICVALALLLFGCDKHTQGTTASFWPEASSIYSSMGDTLSIERIAPDTLQFYLGISDAHWREIGGFFNAPGKMIKRKDTIFFKLLNGHAFVPLLSLGGQAGDSISSVQHVRYDASDFFGFEYVGSYTDSFSFKKLNEIVIGKDTLFIFSGRSSRMKPIYEARFFIHSRQGITGIWYFNCPEEDERFCSSILGIGSYPDQGSYMKVLLKP